MNVVRRETMTRPTEDELRHRIDRHVRERPGQEQVVQAWDSYLSALLEWGLLDHQAYLRLAEALPMHDRTAVEEILLGFEDESDAEAVT